MQVEYTAAELFYCFVVSAVEFAVASWFPGDIYASRRRYAAQRWCSENRAMAFGNRVRAQTYA
jgi:hypothetical protein